MDLQRRRGQLGRIRQRPTHLFPERSLARSTGVTSDIRGCFRPRLWGLGHWMTSRKHLWKMDNIHLMSTVHAGDICLAASNNKIPCSLVKECFACFEAAGVQTGMDKTFLTSTVRSPTASLNIDNRSRGQKKSHMSVRSLIPAATAAQGWKTDFTKPRAC